MTLIDTTTSTAITYQTIAIQRRIRVSSSVAHVYVAHVFGEPRRGDTMALHAMTASRVASSTGALS